MKHVLDCMCLNCSNSNETHNEKCQCDWCMSEISVIAKDFCLNTPRLREESGIVFYGRLTKLLTDYRDRLVSRALHNLKEIQATDIGSDILVPEEEVRKLLKNL